MNLTPREKDKLLVSLAAMVARRRLEDADAVGVGEGGERAGRGEHHHVNGIGGIAGDCCHQQGQTGQDHPAETTCKGRVH